MSYNFVINEFEGPLDLLLHLIKESKMSIYDIEIEKITNQYINFINSMKDANIDVASEYMVMASELLNLKSRMLLNKDIEEEVEENSINSVEDLQQKLIDYEKYKHASDSFKSLEDKRNEIFTKNPSSMNEFIDQELKIDNTVTVNELLNAFALFLERQKLQKPINTRIVKREYNIDDRCKSIINTLSIKRRVEFTELFDILSKDYIIITFLSILELAKKDEIFLKQDNNFDKIFIEKK